MKKRSWLKCNCGLEDTPAMHPETCPVGASQRAHHRTAVKREERQQTRALRQFKASTNASAHKMLDGLLAEMSDELLQHALEGRGFRVNIQIVEPTGMPWKPDPAPEPEPERLIIMPNEQ